MKYKLKFIFFFLELFFSPFQKETAQSHNLQWAKSIGGIGEETGFNRKIF